MGLNVVNSRLLNREIYFYHPPVRTATPYVFYAWCEYYSTYVPPVHTMTDNVMDVRIERGGFLHAPPSRAFSAARLSAPVLAYTKLTVEVLL